jgi:hypothetical protein
MLHGGSSGSGVREESVQRAKAVFNTIKGWLVSMNAANPQSGPGVTEEKVKEFLDTQWKPPLTAAEKKWILGSWPGRIQSDAGVLCFYADLLADSPQAPAGRPRTSPSTSSYMSSPSDTRPGGGGGGGGGVAGGGGGGGGGAGGGGVGGGGGGGGSSFLPAGSDRTEIQSPVFPSNASAIIHPSNEDLSLNGIHTPPIHQKATSQAGGAHHAAHTSSPPSDSGGWAGIELPPPPSSTPPNTAGRAQRPDNGGKVTIAPAHASAATSANSSGNISRGERDVRVASLEAEVSSLRHKLMIVSKERDDVSQENRRLSNEVRELKDSMRTSAFITDAGRQGGAVDATGDEWKVSIRVEEAQNLPDATSNWNDGQPWHQQADGDVPYLFPICGGSILDRACNYTSSRIHPSQETFAEQSA